MQDDLEYRSTQRGEDLAKITTVTKKIGQWVDELAVSDYLKEWIPR